MNPPSPNLVGNSLESHSRHLSPYLSAMQQIANTEDEGHFSSFIEVLDSCNDKFGSSTRDLRKITERLKKISSVGQWEKFSHTAGGSIPMRIIEMALLFEYKLFQLPAELLKLQREANDFQLAGLLQVLCSPRKGNIASLKI
ncbi:hypothetical protein AVEN_185560-1 [Araneus ventricosus]|uniref:Uncharacterized protein n=1 Tax=Araneus ventricosus TaxID=182803 RepID=A0A4Y2HD13_ARAVE|nr:hypothetical protein AVEN_185560-1 [Araneus ventricosus]